MKKYTLPTIIIILASLIIYFIYPLSDDENFRRKFIKQDTTYSSQYRQITIINEKYLKDSIGNKLVSSTFKDTNVYYKHVPTVINTVNLVGSIYMLFLSFFLLISFIISYYIYNYFRIVHEFNDKKSKSEVKIQCSTEKNKRDNLLLTIDDLEKSILKYQTLGAFGLLTTLLTLLILGLFVTQLFQSTIDDILKFSHNESYLAILLIVLRTSLLGSLIITFVVYAFRFTNSCFDQAVRFNKRKHASLFLMEVLDDFGQFSIESEKAIMNAFREWNVSVESAFTDIKYNPKQAKQFFEIMKEMIKQENK